jgi:integrase
MHGTINAKRRRKARKGGPGGHGGQDERTRFLHRPKPGIINFRVNGKTVERLPSDEAAPAFAKAYDALLARALDGEFGLVHGRGRRAKAKIVVQDATLVIGGVKQFRPPQIGWFLNQWLESDFFATVEKLRPKEKPYSQGTQTNYRQGVNVLRTFALEGGATMADMRLNKLTPRLARIYIQKIKTAHGGAAAVLQKTILSKLWQFALTSEHFDEGDMHNPMRGGEIKPPYQVHHEHKDWPKEVIEAFLRGCDENLYLAFFLLLCTGQRVGDVVKLKWKQIDNGYLALTQKKTGERLLLKLPKKLLALLDKREHVSDYILTHIWQRPYSRDSLTHRIKDVLRVVAPNGRFAPSGLALSDYTTHGLRKNAGIMLALNGASIAVIMACLGHKTEKMACYYIRLANQKTLAEQGADIMDAVFEREDAEKAARARAAIKRVR